ncbi:hypothetical protein C5Y96_05200 [Blastopirellula marina]|uniref:Leucine Rich repeats (2 copies) n=1 Tax=Blastopirellula marina TaxID=124 RepID=A0A2S8G481_9BACT|nr:MULTISPECIES: hypothetical protein [Pirellulaceae]PQO39255.1 hypothetical protein C5Y96_05200 [Blastopirellula marina]RCS55563.1 hypothetical protein DTL36_05210 [Bremerella cremea]
MLIDFRCVITNSVLALVTAVLLAAPSPLPAQQNTANDLMPKWEDLKPQPAQLPEKYVGQKFQPVDLSKYGLPVTVDLLSTMEVEQSFSLPQVEITDTNNDRFLLKIEFGKPTFRFLLRRASQAFELGASMSGKTAAQYMQDKEFLRFADPSVLAISSPDPWGEPGKAYMAWGTRAVGKFDYKMTIGESALDTPKMDELQLAMHIFQSLKANPSEPKTILEELAARGVDVEDVDDPAEIDTLKFDVVERFTEAGYEFIAPLKNLEIVRHGFSPATDKLLEALQDKQKLARLDVSSGDITDAGLAYLKDKTELTSLDLAGTLITDEGLANLADLKNLRTLSLGETQITGEGLAYLANLPELSNLDLHSTPLTDDNFRHLAKLKHLKQLNLYDNQLTGEGLQHLAELGELNYINLSKSPHLSPATLAALGALPNLERLAAIETQITPNALTAINVDTLESLELGETPTTDAQLEKLQRFTKLKRLGISDCDQIDGSGFVYLKEMPALESLSLPRTISAEALLKLKDMPNIKSVNLDTFATLPAEHSYYQKSDVEALKQARPDLKLW